MSEELTRLRTETGKIYGEEKDPKTGAPRYTQEAVTGPIHFKESYADSEGWQDIDRTYAEASEIKGIGKVLIYPKLPNIVTVFQDICGYQIQSRSNPDHIARVELVSVDGQPVTSWLDTAALKTYVSIHPYRVGVWKDFSKAISARSTTMRWKVTELGNSEKDSHPFAFRETPEAYSTKDYAALDPLSLEQVKVAIQTQRTRIDDTSWHWDEIIPAAAKLVDTDYSVAAGGDDGYVASATATLSSNGYYLLVGANTDGSMQHSFMRFPNISIGAGSTINSAVLKVRPNGGSTSGLQTDIYLNDVDNATAPTTYAGFNALALTSAYTEWDNPSTSSSYQSSPSITSVVQEVVDRVGWAAGQALQVVWKAVTGGSYNRYVQIFGYDFGSLYPLLSLTWTEAATGHPASKRMGGIPFAALRRGVW